MHIIINNFINSSYYLIPKNNFKFNLKLNKNILDLINKYYNKNNFKINNNNHNIKKNYYNFKNIILIDKKLNYINYKFIKIFKKFILYFFIKNKFKFFNKFFKLIKKNQKKILKKYNLKFLKIFISIINKNNINKILKLLYNFKILLSKYYDKKYIKNKIIKKNKLFINYLTYQYNVINSLLGYQTLLSSSLNENFFLLREFNLKKQFLYYFEIDLPNMSRKILKKKYILTENEEFYLYTTPFKIFSILPLIITENQNKFFKTYYKSTSLKNHLKGNLELINLINLNYNFIKSLFIFKKKINFNLFNNNLNFYNIYYFNNNINYLIKLKNFIFFNNNILLNLKFYSYPDIHLKFFFKKNKIIKIFNNFKKINYFKFYIKKFKILNKILNFKFKTKFKLFKFKFKKILNLVFYKTNKYIKIKKKNNKFYYKKKKFKKIKFNEKNLKFITYKIFLNYKKFKKNLKKKKMYKNISIFKKLNQKYNFKIKNFKLFKIKLFKTKFKKIILRLKQKNLMFSFNNLKLIKKFNFLYYFNRKNKINKIKNFFNYKKKKFNKLLFNNLNLKNKLIKLKKKKLVKNLNYIYLKFKLILKFNNIILNLISIKNNINKFKFLKKYFKYLYYFFFKFLKKIKINKIIKNFFKFIKKKFFITIYLNYKQIILTIFLNLIVNYFINLIELKKIKKKKIFNIIFKKKIIFLKKLVKNIQKSNILFNLLYKYFNLFYVINKIDKIDINKLILYNFNNIKLNYKKFIWLNEMNLYNFIINYKNSYILTNLNAST